MSRRAPNPAAERAAQNQQTLKSLLKLEPNKVCADCKRNKHPRWASWNLGVFICIRCSGVHRSMGTHISRVKSVDLDSWTDEQLASILSWGNARANKYWEAKLAPGHVPSEAKIENFIRTKYELKRWVMDGPMPDPATLDAEADDDIPLSLVKEKQTIERKESIRKSSVGRTAAPVNRPRQAAPVIDLIGGDEPATHPPRAVSAGPAASQVPPKAAPAPPKATASTKDSLLGLDFLGSQPSAPARPSSTTAASNSSTQSRPDLKQSILSLYATAPRAQPSPQPNLSQGASFGGMHSPTLSQTSTGGLVDAFGSLNFSATASSQLASPKPVDAFSGLSSLTPQQHNHQPLSSSALAGLSGGTFFDTKPAASTHSTTIASKPPSASPTSAFGGLAGFGGLGSLSSTASPATPARAAPPSSSNALGVLFDFTSPPVSNAAVSVSQPSTTSPSTGQPPSMSSVFNLSSPTKQADKTTTAATTTAPSNPLASGSVNWSNSDVWGNDAWGTTEMSTSASTTLPTTAPKSDALGVGSSADFGWGSTGGSFASQSIVPGAGGGFSPAPKVAEDEEFGGWASSTAPAPSTTAAATGNGAPKSGGFGTDADLFSNVWG